MALNFQDKAMRPLIMGILNVTPDSFSDGGRHVELNAAVRHGLALYGQGADIIDVGGESTRPGSQRIGEAEQIRRVVQVIAALRKALDDEGEAGRQVIISIDTTRSAVAAAALDAGAAMLNDVSAGREDEGMFTLAAERNAPIALMHMQGEPGTMQQNPQYDDVVREVTDHLQTQAEAALKAGVRRERIILDPGIGFGKTREHNLSLLGSLDRFVALGFPVLLGASRKRFMGSICTRRDGTAAPPVELIGATCATTAMGVAAGVKIFRVHDVEANRQAADVAWAICGHYRSFAEANG